VLVWVSGLSGRGDGAPAQFRFRVDLGALGHGADAERGCGVFLGPGIFCGAACGVAADPTPVAFATQAATGRAGAGGGWRAGVALWLLLTQVLMPVDVSAAAEPSDASAARKEPPVVESLLQQAQVKENRITSRLRSSGRRARSSRSISPAPGGSDRIRYPEGALN